MMLLQHWENFVRFNNEFLVDYRTLPKNKSNMKYPSTEPNYDASTAMKASIISSCYLYLTLKQLKIHTDFCEEMIFNRARGVIIYEAVSLFIYQPEDVYSPSIRRGMRPRRHEKQKGCFSNEVSWRWMTNHLGKNNQFFGIFQRFLRLVLWLV